MQGVVWLETEINEIVGDGLYGMFDTWFKREWPYGSEPVQIVRAFAMWMVSTPEGQDAMDRIREFPRQLSLKFPDDTRPWRKIESDGRTVYVSGEAFVFECPTCGTGV